MTFKTSDFIKFDSNFTGEHGDFSGEEAAFTAEERLDFLSAYSSFLQRKYDAEKSRKAIREEDVKSVAIKAAAGKKVLPAVRKRTVFDKAKIYLSDAFSGYKKIKLYGGATVENSAFVFFDKPVPPIPSCTIKADGAVKRATFSVKIADDYLSVAAKRGVKQKPLVTTVGNYIAFRNGITEVAEIKFYDNGGVYARVGKRDFYHHDAVYLGDFFTDRANVVAVEFYDNAYTVTFNGVKTENVAYTNDLPVDTFFISGGMYSVGNRSVKVDEVITENGEPIDLFERGECAVKEEFVGEKKLPYCIAGHKNADKRIIARVNYNYGGDKKAILHADTLNPCGEISVNGKAVFSKADFTSVEVDITEYLKIGDNEITLVVNPRAPEVNYSWHRNKDPYVGWYLSDFYIDEIDKIRLSDLRVKTLKVLRSSVKAEISFKSGEDGQAEVFLKKIFPEEGEEISLGKVQTHGGKYDGIFEFSAEPWTVEKPVLYSVRAEIKDGNGVSDDIVEETGFRTIEQKDGELLLNGERIIIKGALLMQFLPPYENIVKSHVCPTDEEIITQFLQIKAMNGNAARMHQLGYGTDDKRFTEYADRLGILLFWTTSLIDSLETVKWGNVWRQKEAYLGCMREVINHPSVIVWEGSNEFHADEFNFDPMFDEFVSAVKAEDDSRLICPSSHVYYGGGIYGNEGFYYQDDGKKDQDFNSAESSFGWTDESVIRSAHNYALLLGYGCKWDAFRKQEWKSQPALLESKKHAYLITEFAVIGRQDDRTEECKKYIKTDSYELGDETRALGVTLTQADWRLSQAYQALCADRAIKLLLGLNADGMAWCCLSGGANDASYLKPPIDFYGYAKYAFYVMRDDFSPLLCYSDATDVKVGKNFAITPKIGGAAKGKAYDVTVAVKDADGKVADMKSYAVLAGGFNETLTPWKPKLEKDGYYEIEYSIKEVLQ